jgi:Mg2+ and Co2+ transporter CorA
MTDGSPLFAFAFRGGRGRALRELEDYDVTTSDVDFMWVHLDLRDVAAQAWLRARPWPPDVIETVAAPIQRGRLFIKPDMIYGHLRDFRDETAAATLQAGSLCVVASHRFIVTGRRLPLLSIEEVRRRIDAGTALPRSPPGSSTRTGSAIAWC